MDKPYVSVILSSSAEIPDSALIPIIEQYRKQTIPIELILSDFNVTKRNIGIDKFIINSGVFNLSRARNQGSKLATSKWLIFSDIDTYYQPDVFENMINIDNPIIRGISRGDVENIGEVPENWYKCANSPFVDSFKDLL